ncbi:serine protein kinase RIO [Nocardioides sp.]|uniref:serine protein kinase RIO n=1 Tax=Nocardioides sp. TaxID=35761 RepID=UPI0027351A9D|nr:RIO1 family regulatory kinase/ATPase [Nocardioides sp.]MDP3892469.1 RIO1 family regulatory kinase/ATPase [Nocardioides sp.]
MEHHPGEPAPDGTSDATDTPLDPRFVFDFSYTDPDGPGQRWSTWRAVEPLCRGPHPRPGWVVTDEAAIDTELGIMKTGKEAEVFLLERAVPDGGPSVVMAAKRYRDRAHRSFHRSATYTEGWSTRRSRDARAVKAKSTFGRELAAAQWATAEWQALTRFWSAGVAVPYPVQIDGTEILMEYISVDGLPAPRLAQVRPEPALLRDYFEQLRAAMVALARDGIAHGDLSAYNILAAGERLVIIDLPQAVDVVGNGQGFDFLMRDCANVCTWFRRRGLDPVLADEDALFADLVAAAF